MKKNVFIFLIFALITSSIFGKTKANPLNNGKLESREESWGKVTEIRTMNMSLKAGENNRAFNWNIYSDYDEEASQIGLISSGDKIQVLKLCCIEDTDYWLNSKSLWCNVQTGNLNGWVKLENVNANPFKNENWTYLETIPNGKKDNTVYKYTSNVYVIDNVYLRKNPWKDDDNTLALIPGKDSKKYVQILKIVKEKDTQVDEGNTITDHWIYVSYDNQQGWIFGGYTVDYYNERVNYNEPEELLKNYFNAGEAKGISFAAIKNVIFAILKLIVILALAALLIFLIYKNKRKILSLFHKKAAPIENKEAQQDMEARQKEDSKLEKTKLFQAKENYKIHERISAILKYMNQGLYGKEEVIRLTLLSAIAGETIFFMGPPGTAKSMIARRMQDAFRDDTSWFEYLMSQFSTPDEICGPISLRKLGRDKYVRLTNGYLPKANIAFLDEIWKSGPAILNTLLTIINEKIYHNGNKPEKVPLIALVAASNEFPEKNKGLEALWDRFTIRVMVNPLQSDTDFFNMIERTGKVHKPNLKYKAYQLTKNEVWEFQNKIAEVKLPEYIKDLIKQVRLELDAKNQEKNRSDDEKYYISDRKWKKIVNVLKASAFLNGRDQVDLMDCKLIAYCIWGTEKQRKESLVLIEEVIKGDGVNVMTSISGLKEQINKFKTDISNLDSSNYNSYIIENARENITNKQYLPLEQNIIKEINKLEQMQAKEEADFEGNLFVDDSFKTIVLAKLSKQQNELEDLKLELEKIHHKFDPDSKIFTEKKKIKSKDSSEAIVIDDDSDDADDYDDYDEYDE